MARDGNGRYILPQNSFYPAIKGNAATPDDFNALVEDIAGALTQSFAADGQTPVQNNLNMNGYRMTNVGAPLGANDAIGRGFLAKGNSVSRTTILTLPTQGSMFDVTGTGTIEGIAASFTGRQAWLRFDSAVTLIDSPTFKMVGGKNWNAQAGDTGLFIETANGEWTCVIRNPMGTASQYDVGTMSNQVPLNKHFSGFVDWFAGANAPDGYLLCNGQAVDRNTYADLFAAIGTIHGDGDGSTTFNVPNMEKRYVRGAGNGLNVGDTQEDEIKSHGHSASSASAGGHSHSGTANSGGAHSHTVGFRIDNIAARDNSYPNFRGVTQKNTSTSNAGAHTHSLSINSAGAHTHPITVGSTGGSETRPKTIVLLPCIRI